MVILIDTPIAINFGTQTGLRYADNQSSIQATLGYHQTATTFGIWNLSGQVSYWMSNFLKLQGQANYNYSNTNQHQLSGQLGVSIFW